MLQDEALHLNMCRRSTSCQPKGDAGVSSMHLHGLLQQGHTLLQHQLYKPHTCVLSASLLSLVLPGCQCSTDCGVEDFNPVAIRVLDERKALWQQ